MHCDISHSFRLSHGCPVSDTEIANWPNSTAGGTNIIFVLQVTSWVALMGSGHFLLDSPNENSPGYHIIKKKKC